MFSKIVSFAPIAFAIVSSVAFAHVPQTCYRLAGRTLASSHEVSRLDGANVDAPIMMPEMVIVAPAPRSAPRARVWTCGPVEANRIGGSQRTCEYR